MGLEVQSDMISGLARRIGKKVNRDFVDDGYTGRDIDRPGFKALRLTLAPGDTVLFAKIERIFRNEADAHSFFGWTDSNGIRVLSAHEQITRDTAFGKAVWSDAIRNAALESNTIQERVSANMRKHALERPGKVIGRLLYGYEWYRVGDEKYMRINRRQGKVVVWIFRMIAKGAEPGEVVRRLNLHGPLRPKGAPWTDSHIRKIILSTTPIGLISRGSLRVQVPSLRLVTPALRRKAILGYARASIRHRPLQNPSVRANGPEYTEALELAKKEASAGVLGPIDYLLPPGLRWQGNRIRMDRKVALVILFVFESYAAGYGLAWIASELKRTGKSKLANGKELTISYLSHLLDRKIYNGTWDFKGERISVKIPKIIPTKLWMAVRARRNRVRRAWKANRLR